MSFKVQLMLDLDRVRENARSIRARTGVPVIAVVKADAYGLGAVRVMKALTDVVDGFYFFDLDEACSLGVPRFEGKRLIGLHGSKDPARWIRAAVQPVVWTLEQAQRLREARPVLCVDTGQQRFACPIEQAQAVIAAGGIDEVLTHAVRPEQARQLRDAFAGSGIKLHAAGSALLSCPEAWLDAVRPGLALYDGAVQITAQLLEVHRSTGPAGYSGFEVPCFGVIGMGYAQGLRPGPCWVAGQAGRVIEVGMQTAFVEMSPSADPEKTVELLGPHIRQADVARAWGCCEQEVLISLAQRPNPY